MKKNREIYFWSCLICFVQIIMLLVHSTQFSQDEIYQPLLYLYGKSNSLAGFYALEQNMWLINIALYCIMVIRKMVQYKEESSYIIIARYQSFREYYRKTYSYFIQYTIVYQIAVFLGALAGYAILSNVRTLAVLNWSQVMLSQFCLLMGNLFFGIILFWCIMQRNAEKWAIIIYPGVPVFALLSGEFMPEKVSNFIPGSWLMLARSRIFSDGGFVLWGVFLAETIVFANMSRIALRRRFY